LLDDSGPGSGASLFQTCIIFRLGDQHGGVFCEVHSTPLAFSSPRLGVLAGRADEPERRMAANAELRVVGVNLKTLRTLHG